MSKKDPAKQEKEIKDPLNDPDIEVVPEEHKKPEEVEVDLNKTSSSSDPAGEIPEKLKNQMFYEMRQQEKRMTAQNKQMMEEFLQRMSSTQAQPKKVAEKLDEFDEEVERVAQTDWRKAVDMRAERIAERKLEEKLKAREEQSKQDENRQHATRVEARGREKVLAEFPDIMDESTLEFKQYMEIYNREIAEDPLFMYNPRKHEIILPELRDKMKDRMVDTNPEIDRLKRVAAGSSTPSRPNQYSNKIMLTQSEIEMCKRSGIPIETYARTKKLGEAGLKEGMVVDE